MSKQYRWCEASGPVPYPDDSHRMLDSYDELVSGDGWAALAELGFVEEVGDAPAKKAAKKAKPAPEPTPLPAAESAAEEEPVAAASSKTVPEMVAEAAAKSDEEPATVSGQAKKVLSRRKNKK